MLELDSLQEVSAALTVLTTGLGARPLLASIDWNDRLIGIIGQKGVGKTTLLLQRMQSLAGQNESLYISLDNPIAQNVPLLELARTFHQEGGGALFLDEVHKYPEWSANIKAIYDSLPGFRVVFSGSSALHLHSGKGDLSRRLSLYHLPTLSLREFAELQLDQKFDTYSLDAILQNHVAIAKELLRKLQPIALLKKFLKSGSYPFYREGLARYSEKLVQAINQTIESDLVFVNNIDPRYVPKLKKLLYLISTSVPYAPNISAISQAIESSRATVSQYLEYLQDAGLIALLRAKGRGYEILAKPEKVYLENTNLLYALGQERSNMGSLRETFLYNQLRGANLKVEYPSTGDFLVRGKIILEVGGKNKSRSQLEGSANAYVVSDGIEIGSRTKIPLWLFGFLY